MYLRRLELKDAPLMLNWMHDVTVTRDLYTDFSSKTIKDAEDFIRFSWEDKTNINLAISSFNDEYMGTVSLKHIKDSEAEFAITVRACAMGHGYSWFGMNSIIKKAFNELGIKRVYWCVSRDNKRAVHFYDKHGFKEMHSVPNEAQERYKNVNNLKWYSVNGIEDPIEKGMIVNCKLINLKTIPTRNAGELSFFESGHDIPFVVKRMYYITKVPEGIKRGYHAHKGLKQMIFCPYGRILLTLENSYGRKEIELSDPSLGILIEEPTWREMLWIQNDSVLCVAASDYYDPNDYIRDYDEFKRYIKTLL